MLSLGCGMLRKMIINVKAVGLVLLFFETVHMFVIGLL